MGHKRRERPHGFLMEAVPEGRVELPWVAPAHFECAAYAISPLRLVAAGQIVADERASMRDGFSRCYGSRTRLKAR